MHKHSKQTHDFWGGVERAKIENKTNEESRNKTKDTYLFLGGGGVGTGPKKENERRVCVNMLSKQQGQNDEITPRGVCGHVPKPMRQRPAPSDTQDNKSYAARNTLLPQSAWKAREAELLACQSSAVTRGNDCHHNNKLLYRYRFNNYHNNNNNKLCCTAAAAPALQHRYAPGRRWFPPSPCQPLPPPPQQQQATAVPPPQCRLNSTATCAPGPRRWLRPSPCRNRPLPRRRRQRSRCQPHPANQNSPSGNRRPYPTDIYEQPKRVRGRSEESDHDRGHRKQSVLVGAAALR